MRGLLSLPEAQVLHTLCRESRLLFLARAVRMFAYGALAVVLGLYLLARGFTEGQIGLLLSLTLAGDAVISLGLSTIADRIGRRKVLLLGAVLMILAGVVFALTNHPAVLLLAAIIGVISPSGTEVGPFLAVEQAALSGLVTGERRTPTLAWYNLSASLATALGALAGGTLSSFLQPHWGALDAYRSVILLYAALGGVLALVFWRLTPAIEVQPVPQRQGFTFGLNHSKTRVMRLSVLFAVDNFAGAFVVQSLVAVWLTAKFGVVPPPSAHCFSLRIC